MRARRSATYGDTRTLRPRVTPLRSRRDEYSRDANLLKARLNLHERPDLDRQTRRTGELLTPYQRGIVIGRLDDRDPADMFVPFDVVPFVRDLLTVLDTDDAGGSREVHVRSEDPCSRVPQLVGERSDVLGDLLEIHRGRRGSIRLIRAKEVVAHTYVPLRMRRHRRRPTGDTSDIW